MKNVYNVKQVKICWLPYLLVATDYENFNIYIEWNE